MKINNKNITVEPLFKNSKKSAHLFIKGVGIATGYGLDDRGVGVRVPDVVQTGSEAHPASYPMGTGGSFPEGKAVRA
jgi:hypothetical protein